MTKLKHSYRLNLKYFVKKKKTKKLILLAVADHRGTRMVQKLIQTIKRQLAVLYNDPNCSNFSLNKCLDNNIENNRLIPNKSYK